MDSALQKARAHGFGDSPPADAESDLIKEGVSALSSGSVLDEGASALGSGSDEVVAVPAPDANGVDALKETERQFEVELLVTARAAPTGVRRRIFGREAEGGEGLRREAASNGRFKGKPEVLPGAPGRTARGALCG